MSRNTTSGPVAAGVDAILSWVILACGVVLVVGIGYVCYGIFLAPDELFGAGLKETGVTGHQSQAILRNLGLACRAVRYASILGAAAVIARYWMFFEAGLALGGIGAGLFFGIPFLVQSAAADYPPKAKAAAEALLTGEFAVAGAVLLGVGATQLLVHSIMLFVSRAKRRPGVSTDISQGAFKEKKFERQDTFLGNCWQLPFCRDSVKRVCPVLHSRKPCWREGRGCYCDQGIVMMLSGDRGPRTPGRSAQGFVSMESLTAARPKTVAEKRAQCLGCPIYLHRQSQKYRLFAPTAVAAVIALVLLNIGRIDQVYPAMVRNAGLFLSRFSFTTPGAGGGQQVPEWAADLARQTSVEWLIVIVGGVLLVSYLIHGLEWALYKAGL